MSSFFKYNIINGKLYVEDKFVELQNSIDKAIELGELLIVMLLSTEEERLNRNILAINSKGEIVWQIQESPHGGNYVSKPFTNMWLSSKGELIAGNWNGVDYKVSIESGKLLEVVAFSR